MHFDGATLSKIFSILLYHSLLDFSFSVWNTILGSSMLTMPWGIYMAGFVPAIFLILAMSGICLFTAYKLLQVHKYHG